MTQVPQGRFALFIDGANLHATSKELGINIDYKRVLDFFKQQGHFIRAYYYTALLQDQEFSQIRPLVDWLDYNGYQMVTKPAKQFTDASGNQRIKGNMDIEIAVDILELSENLDSVVLFSGDGDFQAAVKAVQRRGKRVTVVSSQQTKPPMVADELRRQADEFIELAEIAPHIRRAGGARPDAPNDDSPEDGVLFENLAQEQTLEPQD
jgi:uncharacterized LabA/DUF88 family protein